MDITDTQSGEVDGAGADLTSDDGKKKKDIRRVQVYDCRPGSSNELPRKFNITDEDYNGFQCALRKEFSVPPDETFIVSTTDREEITEDIYKLLLDGKTLQLLESVHQMLPTATQERIEYQPHYHTLVQCGMYEYYASEGQEALPYAFAELIDNALSATRNNIGIRRIEIRLLFDESQGGPAIVVMDNGCGMTSKQLKNWAVYRLSKFIRDNTAFTSQEPGYVRPNPVPRSLNSDISYFGVGGKQAVFYIGQSVRMISKPASSPDVHEFIMSKEEFERKERDREDIYSGFIRNRMPGDSSHVNSSEELFLVPIVNEEVGKDSFTAVVITRLQQAHITYLKQHFTLWTRELAHTYHYYIHGINGNSLREMRVNDSSNNIDIQICLFEKPNRIPRLINLRDVNNDMQTLYIRSSVSTFEFKATGPKDLLVEGLVRYHPFLYDQETYPLDPYSASTEKEDDDCMVVNPEGRGKRPIFECYWNGRLIPYTTVSEFKWCEKPKKTDVVPWECYNRISGVLFANDRFEVSTNKLTFMDLELQLREKATIFTRVNNGQEQRVNIEKEFTSWLEECHVQFDKQVMFLGFLGEMRRADMVKRLQFPWARFKAIKWDGKTYSKGQFVKSIKTNPIWFGSIVQFLLYGEHEGDVYATGGYVQIALEPKELYNDEKIIPISKIDRLATTEAIKENIKLDSEKLPDQLRVSWPDGNAWIENSIHPAGTPLGPIKVEILNKRGDVISRLANSKKLLIELEVIWHSPEGNVQINSHTGVHSTKWEYWFKSMRNLSKLGKYCLNLQTRPADCSASEWEKMPDKRLPSYTLNFSIKECDAVSFAIDAVLSPVHVGVPFDLQLHFRDRFNHPTQPPNGFKPQLKSSSLQLSYEKVTFEKNTVIKNVKALVKATHWNKMHTVSVHIPGLKPSNQSLQLNLQPGPPHTLFVLPAEDLITIENKTPVNFKVEVHDECQNVTKNQNLIINCELLGAPGLPLEVVDCSNSGSGLFLSKPLCLKGVSSEQILTAKFSIENNETVSCVERRLRVLPSSQVSRLEIYRQEVDSDDVMVLQNCERIDWTAGDTLGNLHFRLFDEGGKLIPLQEKLTSNIQVFI
ncbi:hypothetical protein DNTS_012405 [Danionella cerebrum]|uniref:SMC hinge domain-containing protein n=1 Tax=Danionella cerebrum TaxID=2873325 RepID=A0A553N0R2_9TELE|nr:hypothetical protein DNTS_012405 [Danionella translucida]